MATRVLVANRGEIAIRVARTLIENGYVPVGVYTADDSESLHRKFLVEDLEVSSYLNIKEVVEATIELGAEALHPGYGFLSENPEFAQEVIRRGLVFVGPPPDIMSLSGDKLASKILAEKLEVPTLPWLEVNEPDDVIEFARTHGYPVIIKAAGGGGGRGVRVVKSEKEVASAVKSAKVEAEKAFKDPRLFVEPYIEHAKHIEVQILGDGDNIIHLYERECSVQRRFQKIIEEAPSHALDARERERLYERAVALASGLKYVNAGTVEFVFDVKNREFYFMEINARIQVEHPVTEMITRTDIVKKQIEIALDKVLDLRQHDVKFHGHAIEARVYAENPYTGEPSPGIIKKYREPGGPGIRVDSGVTEGSHVSDKYDPLIAKVIAWGPNRRVAIQRLDRALKEYVLEGVATNMPLLRQVIHSPEFVGATYTTRFLESTLPNMLNKMIEEIGVQAAIFSALVEYDDPGAKTYSKKPGILQHVLRGERVSSIKRHAWYYYMSLKTSLDRYYRGSRRNRDGESRRRQR